MMARRSTRLPGLRCPDERARCQDRGRRMTFSHGSAPLQWRSRNMSATGVARSCERLVIAVDGPAASGKGTIAKRLAAHFGLPHLDTGLLYRAVGWRSFKTGEAPAEVAARLGPGDLDDPALRGDEAGQQASKVGAIPEVRTNLLKFQREFSSRPRVRCSTAAISAPSSARRPGEALRHRLDRGSRRKAVSGVAGERGGHYKTARSCRDGGAGPSRQRTGGCTT